MNASAARDSRCGRFGGRFKGKELIVHWFTNARVWGGALFLWLSIAGCSQLVKGTPVSEYKSGNDPVMGVVATDGEYSLYQVYETTPRVTYWLTKGEPIGFKPSVTGRVIAVAGSRENTLPDKNYVWKRRPDDLATVKPTTKPKKVQVQD